MTVAYFRPRPTGAGATDTAASGQTARVNWILDALNNPSGQPVEVAQAIAILTAAAPGTSSTDYGLSLTSSAATSGRFENVVELITSVIHDLDDTSADYLFSEPLPHFVPANWSHFLNGTAVEDEGFELPWLADLD